MWLTILKKFWKEIAVLVLLFLLFSLYGLVNHYKNKYEQEKQDKDNLVQLTSGKDLIIKKYQNQNDHLVVRTSQLEFENKTVKQLAEEGQLKWLNEFGGLKKSMKNLESAYRLQSSVIDSIGVKLEQMQGYYINDKGDTVIFQGVKFNYQDKYTSLKARQINPDSAIVTYNIKVPLAGAVFWKRKWFLGRKYYQAEMVSENPNVSIDSVVSLTIKKHK